LTDAANYEVIELPKDKNANRSIAVNKKAFHDYFVEETYEAGIELTGTEVKSLREGKANIKEAWCAIENGEIFIKGMHISPYDHGNVFNVNPLRVRKLLMHKKEISHLYSTVKLAGYSIVPLSVYFKGSLVKMQIGLCKGKKLYDKRDDAAKRDAKRAIDRALKQNNQ
jgi:SsrA-binding protein